MLRIGEYCDTYCTVCGTVWVKHIPVVLFITLDCLFGDWKGFTNLWGDTCTYTHSTNVF